MRIRLRLELTRMSASPSAYLVLASQRSGSTLLVESLRATGVAGEPQEFFQYLPTTSRSPQPRQWFAGVDDESILRLLDPLDEGKPDLAPAEIWRDYIRTVGRTPNGVWGGKLMWNQTPLLLRSRQGPARPLRRRPARRDPRRHRLRPGPGPRLPAGRGVAGGVVLAGGADPGLAGSPRSRARRPRRVPRRRDRARRHHAARAGEGLAGLVRRGEHRADRRVVSGAVAQSHPGRRHGAGGAGPRSAAGARRRCWSARPISAPTNG